MKEALLYKKTKDGKVSCFLCGHRCLIAEGEFGFCGVRQNKGGTLYTHTYGKLVSSHVDPIEKKPLFHFLPGSQSFSIAAPGCNFRCGFCQNWEISQRTFKTQGSLLSEEVPPSEIVEAALRMKCKSISYTYTEPTIFFEYALETAKLAKAKGLRNVFVTNGYMTGECLRMLGSCLDAANVDLKFFNDDSYKKICAGSLKPVLDSIRLMREMNIWVEVTTLVVPGENDSEEELSGIAGFLAELDKDIPWHISRFHPDYQFSNYDATPREALDRAERIGRGQGLRYIYLGNVSGPGSDTFCPSCEKTLIRREIFDVLEYTIKEGKCAYCKGAIAGVFS